MFPHIKELIVVMTLAATVFFLARPLCLHFMLPEDFARRRNLWLGLTAIAFVSPSFWVYAGAAALATIWAARRDSNPVVLFVLLFAIIPKLSWYIPFVGINQLFDLSEARLLAIVLLIPLAFAHFRERATASAGRFNWIDFCIVSYAVLQLVLLVPYETGTNSMRRAVLLLLDSVVVYYVFSRALSSREKLIDALAVFTLAATVSAAIGIFESTKGWLMYERIGPDWGAANFGAFLMRSDSLRAQAAYGHSLTYGYVLTMAFALWLPLRERIGSATARLATTLFLAAGIYFSHSRGPWFAAVAVYLIYLLLSPRGLAALGKGLTGFGLLAAGLAFTPIGERVIGLLPFIGTRDQDTIAYRQRLADESWQLIWQNPVFGDPFVLSRMEDLRQGQGIIDLMNGYAAIALFSGFAGLALFAAFLFGATFWAYLAMRRFRKVDAELASVGAGIVAALLGSAIFIATASVDWVEYVLVGMAVAFATATARSAVPAPAATLSPLAAAHVRNRMTY